MLRPLEYVYYKIFRFLDSIGNDIAPFAAAMGVAWTLLMNIICLSLIAVLFTGNDVVRHFSNPIGGVFTGMGILVFVWFMFLRTGKHEQIVQRYQSESGFAKTIATSVTIAYLIGSFWITLKYAVPYLADQVRSL